MTSVRRLERMNRVWVKTSRKKTQDEILKEHTHLEVTWKVHQFQISLLVYSLSHPKHFFFFSRCCQLNPEPCALRPESCKRQGENKARRSPLG